jgi:hypothetical protein
VRPKAEYCAKIGAWKEYATATICEPLVWAYDWPLTLMEVPLIIHICGGIDRCCETESEGIAEKGRDWRHDGEKRRRGGRRPGLRGVKVESVNCTVKLSSNDPGPSSLHRHLGKFWETPGGHRCLR